MKNIKKIILCLCLFSIIGCSSTIPVQKSNLTVGMIKNKVIKNKTTQNEVLSIFGAPNLITKNKQDNEVWSYNKMSTDASTSSNFSTLLLIGGSSAIASKTTSSFDWIVTFNSNDTVKDYSVISSSY